MDSQIQSLIRQRTQEIIRERNILGLQPDQISASQLPSKKNVIPQLKKDLEIAKHELPGIPNDYPVIEGKLVVSAEGGAKAPRRSRKAAAEVVASKQGVMGETPPPAPVPVAPPKAKRAPSEHSMLVKEFMKLHPGVKLGEASKAIAKARREAAN